MSGKSQLAMTFFQMHPDAIFNQSKPFLCECGRVIGHEVEVAGIPMLSRNGTCDWNAHGVCTRCGKDYHWTVSDTLLKRILERTGQDPTALTQKIDEKGENHDSGN